MESPVVYSPIDTGKILSDTATNLIKSVTVTGWNRLKKYFKDIDAEESIELGTAFNEYIRLTQEKASKVKTLIYRKVPKNIYSFYECVGLSLEERTIDTNSVKNILENYCNRNRWYRKIYFNETFVPEYIDRHRIYTYLTRAAKIQWHGNQRYIALPSDLSIPIR